MLVYLKFIKQRLKIVHCTINIIFETTLPIWSCRLKGDQAENWVANPGKICSSVKGLCKAERENTPDIVRMI